MASKKLLFVNFKNYQQSFDGFPSLYQELEGIAKKYPRVKVIFTPPPLLATKLSSLLDISVWSQHLDPLPLKRATGFSPIEGAKFVGIEGTFLNHSEKPLGEKKLQEALVIAKKAAIATMVFVSSPSKISVVKRLEPDFIAYEPPELIGAGVSRGVSVASAKKEIIPKAVKEAGSIPLIVGAGIHEGNDIRVAIESGSAGGAVSSAIVTAPNPPDVLGDLLAAF
jgi:triosephosphate isomerase